MTDNKEETMNSLVFRWSLFLHKEMYICDTTYFDMGQLLSGGMLCMLSARTVSRVYLFVYLSNVLRTKVYIIYATIFKSYPSNLFISKKIKFRHKNY